MPFPGLMIRRMTRGEIWTVSGGDYAGKPRPALIVQTDAFQTLESVTVCPFTTDKRGTDIVRVLVEPNEHNGLQTLSKLMADKITTLPRSRLGKRIGVLDADDLRRVETAILIFLGLT